MIHCASLCWLKSQACKCAPFGAHLRTCNSVLNYHSNVQMRGAPAAAQVEAAAKTPGVPQQVWQEDRCGGAACAVRPYRSAILQCSAVITCPVYPRQHLSVCHNQMLMIAERNGDRDASMLQQVPAVQRSEAAAAQAVLPEPSHLVPQPLCDAARGACQKQFCCCMV